LSSGIDSARNPGIRFHPHVIVRIDGHVQPDAKVFLARTNPDVPGRELLHGPDQLELEQMAVANDPTVINLYVRTNNFNLFDAEFMIGGRSRPASLQQVYFISHPSIWRAAGFPSWIQRALSGSLNVQSCAFEDDQALLCFRRTRPRSILTVCSTFYHSASGKPLYYSSRVIGRSSPFNFEA